jgi:uncharacterized glyoxalase superfamily protein PhnB
MITCPPVDEVSFPRLAIAIPAPPIGSKYDDGNHSRPVLGRNGAAEHHQVGMKGEITMDEIKRPTLAAGVYYKDPRAALAWLEAAFGFESTMVVVGEDGEIGHSEMRLGDGLIMVGREWDEKHRSPASVDGVNTQSVHIQLEHGLDAHCDRARKAGAVILREPVDQFYGDRSYMAADPEGHIWSFGQTVKSMTNEEMARVGGVTIVEHL